MYTHIYICERDSDRDRDRDRDTDRDEQKGSRGHLTDFLASLRCICVSVCDRVSE